MAFTDLSFPDERVSPRLIIDLDAAARNYQRLAEAAPGAETAAVVKAQAYGLGAAQIARRLVREGCRSFFVATPEEGAELRRALGGGEADIWVFNGYRAEMRSLFLEHRLGAILNCEADLDAAFEAPGGPVALHIDTGMNRLGLDPERAGQLAADQIARLDLRLVMSHLACAEERDAPMNAEQRDRFADVCAQFSGVRRSLSNTGGVRLGDDYHFDLTRPGIGLYGATARPGEDHGLEPVVRLEAPVLQLHQLEPGDPVGYGAAYVADKPRLAATVAAGYADGLPRALSASGYARFGNAKAPILGRISMDLTVLDVTDCEDPVRQGAPATFLGADLDAVATTARTLPYEILTGLGRRAARVYEGGS
ncbi:MAG: alanine racemase [Oceanicaulis sp.]